MITPADYGMPPKFKKWRGDQLKWVEDVVQSKKPYTIQIAPTGVGKSLIYTAGMVRRGGRTIILTSTKGLQDQLMQDFAGIGMVEVRGRGNYRCKLSPGISAEDGLCRFGVHCGLREGGCDYYDAVSTANASRLVVTNYAYWFHHKSKTLEEPDNLVLDEAHDAPGHLFSFGEVEINMKHLTDVLDRSIRRHTLLRRDEIREMSAAVDALLDEEVKKSEHNFYWFSKLRTVRHWLNDLQRLLNHDYVVDMSKTGKLIVGVREVRDYAKQVLFKDIPYVLLTSATVNPYTAELLGIPINPHVTTLYSYPSPFPITNRYVYVVGRQRVDRKMGLKGELKWAQIIDKILRARQDRKGIIHTVSYKRQGTFKHLSDFANRSSTFYPNSKNLMGVIKAFKDRQPPAILVSPAVTTGYDFPYEECSFQIIGKVPFPNTSSGLWEARIKANKHLQFYQAWQNIIQATGRGVRAPDDRCETFIVDWHFKWLHKGYKRFAPKWFLDAVRWTPIVPKPITLSRG